MVVSFFVMHSEEATVGRFCRCKSEYAENIFSLKFSVYKFCEKFRKKDKIIAFSVATFREKCYNFNQI